MTLAQIQNRPMLESKIKNRVFFRILLALGAGIIASFALPPFGFTPALLALSLPLFWVSHSSHARHAFVLGFAMGFGWFIIALSWIAESFLIVGIEYFIALILGVFAIPIIFGLIWGGVFGLVVKITRTPYARLWLGVMLLCLAEYGRGFIFSGFPWNPFGMVFAAFPAGLGASAWVGVWGLTVIAALSASVGAFIFMRAWVSSLGIIALGLGMIGLGGYHISQPLTDTAATGAMIRIVQPAIPQQEKWDTGLRNSHFHRFITLSHQASESNKGESPDLIIWPEVAFAGVLEHEQAALLALASQAAPTTPIIIGALTQAALTQDGANSYHNSAIVVEADTAAADNAIGAIGDIYNKQKLVPFGEYKPLNDIFPIINAIVATGDDLIAGTGSQILRIHRQNGTEIRLLPLICYEVIFTSLTRDAHLQTHADMIVVLTNDAWFGDTIGPHQHLAHAQMRAAEMGLPLVRSANTGISAAIDAYGGIIEKLDYDVLGSIDRQIGGRIATPYTRLGTMPFWLMVAGGIIIAGVLEIRKKTLGWDLEQ